MVSFLCGIKIVFPTLFLKKRLTTYSVATQASSPPTNQSTSNRSRVWPFRKEVLKRILRFLWPNATPEEHVRTLFREIQAGKKGVTFLRDTL